MWWAIKNMVRTSPRLIIRSGGPDILVHFFKSVIHKSDKIPTYFLMQHKDQKNIHLK